MTRKSRCKQGEFQEIAVSMRLSKSNHISCVSTVLS